MDPVTIIGAVGSVVGITAFGLQISQYLSGFIDEYNSADEGLSSIIFVIESINATLREVESLLQQERKNIETYHKAPLFSKQAIYSVKSIVDECLRIFWKIEATISRKDNARDLELRVERKLTKWKNAIACATEKEPPPLLVFDLNDGLSKRQRFKWSFKIGAKLEKYIVQLDRQQNSLGTVLHTVQLGTLIANPSRTFDDEFKIQKMMRETEEMYMSSGLRDRDARDWEDQHSLLPQNGASSQQQDGRDAGISAIKTSTSGKHPRFATNENALDELFQIPQTETISNMDDPKPAISAKKLKEYRQPSVADHTAETDVEDSGTIEPTASVVNPDAPSKPARANKKIPNRTTDTKPFLPANKIFHVVEAASMPVLRRSRQSVSSVEVLKGLEVLDTEQDHKDDPLKFKIGDQGSRSRKSTTHTKARPCDPLPGNAVKTDLEEYSDDSEDEPANSITSNASVTPKREKKA